MSGRKQISLRCGGCINSSCVVLILGNLSRESATALSNLPIVIISLTFDGLNKLFLCHKLFVQYQRIQCTAGLSDGLSFLKLLSICTFDLAIFADRFGTQHNGQAKKRTHINTPNVLHQSQCPTCSSYYLYCYVSLSSVCNPHGSNRDNHLKKRKLASFI